ncbi:vicilin-like seed storage protein At4g36700 [Hordeum vulgare subsp. vulgare]|nr:vicilin-like seed storage protein At4g36700 [Hordeum vulgare subsp. vulgare]
MAAATARWLVLSLLVSALWASSAAAAHETKWKAGAAVGGQVVEKERRRVVVESEAGTVTATDVADAAGTVYRLQFITMDPGALFLPVQLHADAVFYVHSGRGKVTYIQEGGSETSSLEVQRGDVYNLEQGSILYIQSYPNATRERLRVYAIFTSNAINCDDPSHPKSEAYSSVSNLLRGFDVKILRQGFGVSSGVVEAITSAKSPQSIITYKPDQEKEESSNWTEEIFDALWGDDSPLNKKKKKDKHKKKDKKDDKSKSKTFNFYSGEPDVKNCFGWSKTMTNKDLQNLRGSDIGMFMVNLTTGSMMGPHWNPKATEIAIVTHGSGIVQVVCPSIPSGAGGDHGHHDEGGRGGGDHGHHDDGGRRRGDHGHHDEGGRRRGGHGHHDEGGNDGQEGIECKNSVFGVKEGDVFVVPRFHPMAQLSFNNGSFVFVGFSTHMGENNPQFLAGDHSVLQVIGKEIVALALGQKNTTAVEKLLSAKSGSTIMACISCAEELERKAEQEEHEGGKGEREREREEEEERERKQREEDERKKREEEERKKREEEERKKREEEERERREEKERKKREEEERERREEKERKKREEEEAARREQEEEEERRRREEEEGGGGQGGGGGDDPREEEIQRRREEEEEGGGRGDDPREEEERRREEEGGRGGRGGDDPWEEEGGDWGDSTKYRAAMATNLKKRYRGRKGSVFRSA